MRLYKYLLDAKLGERLIADGIGRCSCKIRYLDSVSASESLEVKFGWGLIRSEAPKVVLGYR